MTSHDVAQFVRQNSGTLRAYNWREVEAMRNSIAAAAAALSRREADIAAIRGNIEPLRAVMQQAQARKDYSTSDAIRAFLIAVSQPLA